ncbi:MAG: purine-nucleoside phosphorylase [Clostridia bacterium]|nr:purine-nucleoside phosphorylase [Clostridia bacterium]
MSTPHNEANNGDFAKTVIMPGDPLRAKYIAENFLEDYKLINSVRGMYAYTGKYKGKEISVMAHGMGMPSIGIYAYELYKFYGVENIIRIGSCGAYLPDLKLFDIILTENVYSESNFALTFNNDDCHIISSNNDLNNLISETANENNINIFVGNTACLDCFDVYMPNLQGFLDRIPKDFNPIGAEMEAFALFYIAKFLNKKASCLMSVVDSKFITDVATAEERQTGLNNMIKLALDSAIKI